MQRALAVLLGLILVAMSVAQKPALKLKAGDRLGVTVLGVQGYDGEYAVASDGSISGRGFGRLVVEGKTLDAAKLQIVNRFKAFMKDPSVTVVLLSEQSQFVYLAGAKVAGSGVVPFLGELDLRQLLSGVELPEEADLMEAHVFRGGQDIGTVNVGELLSGQKVAPKLKANDVVTVTPVSFVRVWVLGLVAKPGQVRVPANSDPYQAIAAAGGALVPMDQLSESRLAVRRGGEEVNLDLTPVPSGPRYLLQTGDTITVTLAAPVRVTVGGEVKLPARLSLKQGATLFEAVTGGGGITEIATTKNVLVVRGGEALSVELDAATPFELHDGDQIVVQKNERSVIAVGEVAKPGSVLIPDKKMYRLTDLIAAAGGLGEKGTFYRVYLGRPGPDGKIVAQMYHVDRFIKDGDLSQNPEVQPGDLVYVDQAKGVSFLNIQQILNSALILFNISRR